MKNTLLFVMATRKICAGAWLALSLLALTSLSTLPAVAQNNAAAYTYTWTSLAGRASVGSADGVGTAAQFSMPYGVAADTNSNVYVADTGNCTIRRITPAGVVSTIAGFAGSSGSADGMNSAARFNNPIGIAVDTNGNVYVADAGKISPPGLCVFISGGNNSIRKISPVGTNWLVSTIAGSTNAGNADGVGNAAQFNNPFGIALDNAGNLYVTDSGNFTVRRIVPVGTNWMVNTIAGQAGHSGFDDGFGTNATFGGEMGPPLNSLTGFLVLDGTGNVYVVDAYNYYIRMIMPAEMSNGPQWDVSTIGPDVPFDFPPRGIASDNANNLYVTETQANTIWKLNTLGGIGIATPNWAGGGRGALLDGTGTNAAFLFPMGVAVSPNGYIYVADTGNNAIRKITSAAVVSTVAGFTQSIGSTDGNGNDARFGGPQGVAVDSSGNIYVADTGNKTIRQITSAGVVSAIAGLAGVSGTNDGAGSYARFVYPTGSAVDGAGNLYVTDATTVRMITPAGVVSTIAGGFNDPLGVAVDSATNLYVGDTGSGTIRKITLVGTNWVVSTIAGPVSSIAIAVDSVSNVYVAAGDCTIRKLTPMGTNWVVNAIAGLANTWGSADGMGSSARFHFVDDWGGVAVDSSGNVYVADSGNDAIREITPVGTNWVVRTIGGLAGVLGSADGAGSAAFFGYPSGIAVDSTGTIYVADYHNNTIRKGVFTAYGATNAVAYSPPAMNSSLTVILLPPEANGQWRFPWEVAWRNSGQAATNLVAGEYPIEFRSIPGWIVIPLSGPVGLTNNQSASITNQYYPTISTVDTNNGGTLTVTLGPNPPGGAGWGFLGNSPPWYPSGYSTNLVAGTYLIDFAPVSGRVTPPNLSVQVQAGLTTLLDENYLLAQSAPGGVLLPAPVPVANISNLTDYPFGFNGQLETDVGYGSGVAVQANVVLTAAHLVFNDQTLSYVSQAYWYFQEEAGVFEPDPLPARGWYLLTSYSGGVTNTYAEQRTNDLEVYAPDTSTPQSRNLDVAALYFLSPVAGGGYGGYLPSDASPNPWLTGTSPKMLVGYPVDGSQFGVTVMPGEMYQTDPQPYPLSLAIDPVDNQQVYTAPWFLSYPGNSGGPLYVQYNGYYYPAGVYLGTLYNGTTPYASAVRAIDGNVVNLITNAATLGDTGTNNSGGGVITIIPTQAGTNTPGYVEIQLGPPAAVVAGAAWSVSGLKGLDLERESWATNYWATNWTVAAYTTNGFQVNFKVIPGWNVPPSQAVTLIPTVVVTNFGYYTVTNPVLVAGKGVGLGITGTTGTVYQLQRRTSLTSGSWLPISTNAILTNGFNLLLSKPATNGNTSFYRAVWLGY